MLIIKSTEERAVKECAKVLNEGSFAVVPTDTIYGIVTDALNYDAVTRLKKLRRPSGRPFVLLIPDISWVGKLSLEMTHAERRLLTRPHLTLVLRKKTRLYYWLGTSTVAVRLPKGGFIERLLRYFARPLVAPSANPEGKPPARNVKEAIAYFGGEVPLYVDVGPLEGKPSALIDLRGKPKVLREGVYSPWDLEKLLSKL